jgi:hypothetical protein
VPEFFATVKVPHPAAHFDIQFIVSDDKFDDVGVLCFVPHRLIADTKRHGEAELERSGICQIALRIAQRRFRSRVGSLATPAAIRRASSYTPWPDVRWARLTK